MRNISKSSPSNKFRKRSLSLDAITITQVTHTADKIERGDRAGGRAVGEEKANKEEEER